MDAPPTIATMNQMACMFCRSEVDLTREHVFPAFMGGELQVPDGSCSRCNGEFAAWEGEIKKEIALLLHLLQVENRYGDVPRAKVDVKIGGMELEGLSGLREPDGSINLREKVQEIVKSDGKKHREGFFVSDESAEKFLARARARDEKTTELPVPEEVVYGATFSLTLRFCASLEARKVVAKIALASIAYKYGVPYALSPQFDRLRKVRAATSSEGLSLRIFCNKS
jgi:hypothetical protein